MISLNDKLKDDIIMLKLKAALMTKDMQLSHQSAENLRAILYNEHISTTDFINEFNTIIKDYWTFNWKLKLLLNTLKNKFGGHFALISWPKVGLIVIAVLIILFLIKKYKLEKQVKKFSNLIFNIVERIAAVCAYYVPLVTIYTAYVPGLMSSYPYLQFFLPDFLQISMDFYMKYPWTLNYGYFFIVMYAVILFKIPKPRFIRFHLVRGLMLLAFQGIPDSFVKVFQSAETLTQDQFVSTNLCLFAINLSWILPCFYQAITHTYPRSSFIRDAIEINVGRDKDEGFKWWNRR